MNSIILGAALILAVIYDRSQNRIPNFLCEMSMTAGLIHIVWSKGINMGVVHCIWAAGLGVVFFFLWLGKILGGGDIKLLMTAGLLLGGNSIVFLMCAGVCLGIHALVLLVIRKNYFDRITLFFQYVMACVENKKFMPYPFDREKDWEEGGIRISYGFFAGHLLAVTMGMYH